LKKGQLTGSHFDEKMNVGQPTETGEKRTELARLGAKKIKKKK